jgi:hypothetical protein
MSYYKAVRLYSAVEVTIFSALLVVWIGGLDERAQFILGITHGFGWIILCILVFVGCTRGLMPWPLLAATVSPIGPLGSTLGFEWLRRHPGTFQADVPAQPAERAHAAPDPAGAGAGGGAARGDAARLDGGGDRIRPRRVH